MIIKTSHNLSKFKAKLFVLCGLNIKKMTWLFIGVWLALQGLSMSIEYLFFGEMFPHVIDSIFTVALSSAYFYYTNSLGEFLLDLHLNGKLESDIQSTQRQRAKSIGSGVPSRRAHFNIN